jgi:hypothetical protein
VLEPSAGDGSIARYTPEWKPEWNDLNDSDPGEILAQTFAWLSEMMLFRMARVPQLNYVKFLELIGVELMPAQPARADISFVMRDDCLVKIAEKTGRVAA